MKNRIVIVALVSMMLLSGCGAGEPQAQESGKETSAVKKVKVQAVQTFQMGQPVTVDAHIIPKVQVSIAAEIGGTVNNYFAHVGDQVSAGDVLLELDQHQLNLELERAHISKDKVLLQLDSMKQELRQGDQEQNNTLKQMKLNLDEVQLSIRDVEYRLNKTVIEAPISGLIVDAADLITGQIIQAGQSVAHIQQLDSLYIEARLTEQDVLQLEHKQHLDVHIPALNETVSADIDFISPAAELGRFKVRLALDNKNLLIKPGMAAHLIINDELAAAVMAVPVAAVLQENNNSHVFVLNDKKVMKKQITTGRKNKNHIEVISGLSMNDTIVIAGQSQLEDGDEVEVAAP